MWDFSSQPGIQPTPPATEAQNLNHWTNRKVPYFTYFKQCLVSPLINFHSILILTNIFSKIFLKIWTIFEAF